MGTNYHLVKERKYNSSIDDQSIEDSFRNEFCINEMSNKLSLVCCGNESPWIETEEMTPKELAKIMLEGLTVCSYWMDTDELKELIKEHMYHNIY